MHTRCHARDPSRPQAVVVDRVLALRGQIAKRPSLWHRSAMGSRPSTEPQRYLSCPKCNAVAAKAETLGRAIVYMRCGGCGETWTIAERRKISRENTRAARFR